MTTQEIVKTEQANFLAPAGTVEDFLSAYQAKKDIISKILVEGVDFGVIPGSTKPALYKAGAEKMSGFYALHPQFSDVETVEDWTGKEHDGEPFLYYRQKCFMYKQSPSERKVLIASADGSCNSWETKYRYRNQERLCPSCDQAAIIKGKEEYGGGWLCWKKNGGCGSKFPDGDISIESQEAGKIKNPNVADLANTILKMAQKRALVAATLIATNTSDYFIQDLDDFTKGEIVEGVVVEEQKKTAAKPRKNKAATEKPTGPVGVLLDLGVDNKHHAAEIATLLKLSSKTDRSQIEELLKKYRDLRNTGHEKNEAAEMALS